MKKIQGKNLLTLLILSSLSFFWQCRENIDDSSGPTDENPVYVESGVFGKVTDPKGEPAENVEVSFDNTIVFTDKNGIFLLQKQLMNSQGAQIKLRKSGYFEMHKTVIPVKGKVVNVSAQLIYRRTTKTIKATAGGSVISNGNANVSFQPNSFLTTSGNPYLGDVKVYTYYLDPLLDITQEEMPGNLTGRDKNGNFVVLRTMGMMIVELEDASGSQIKLDPQIPAELSIPIPTSLNNKAQSSIPLWYFDATKGGWIEEGTAYKTGDRYIGKVKHFTPWNWDFPFQSVNLKFRLIDKNGNPLANTFFDVIDLTNFGHGSGSTNNDGSFMGKIPENSSFDIYSIGCTNEIIKSFQSLTSDIDLGDIKISNSISTFNLRGLFLDCNGNKLNQAYAILKEQNSRIGNVYQINPDGTLNIFVEYCNSGTYSLKVIDMANNKEKSNLNFIITNEPLFDLGTITVCEERTEFIKIFIYGKEQELESRHVSDFGQEFLFGENSDSTSLNLNFQGFPIGSNKNPLQFTYRNYNEEILIDCNMLCSNVNYKFTEVGIVGQLVKGTFDGTLPNLNSRGPQGNLQFTGSFSFKRN